MSDANQTTNLEQFPDSAIEVVHGKVQRLNRVAMHCFPELRSGMELPGFLSTPLEDPDGAGTFTHQGILYLFSRVAGAEGSLLLVRPAPKSGLTDRQLDGFVRQMRGFLQEVLLEFQSTAGQEHDNAFNRSFFRMYRLLSNLDFMRGMDSPSGTPFHPITLDLAGLCRRLTEEAAFLLQQAGVQLRFQCETASLLIPGDPALIQKLLLTLISNSAKPARSGEVTLTLERRGGQALLWLGDRGSRPPGTAQEWALPSRAISWNSIRGRFCWVSGTAAGCWRWSPCPLGRCGWTWLSTHRRRKQLEASHPY